MVACATRCWGGPYNGLNLELNETQFPTLQARCSIRYDRLKDAMAACAANSAWCGGITKDTGFNLPKSDCKVGKKLFELRSSHVDAPWSGATAYFLHNTASDAGDCEPQQQCTPALPQPKRDPVTGQQVYPAPALPPKRQTSQCTPW